MALLAGGIALVTDAIVQTDSWGWASTKFAVALLLAAVVLGSFIYRCNTVGNPVIHLGLFKANNFRWADMTMIVFAIGFNAMFLGNVLFLTRVWRYSNLKAGLAISVGPLIVIAFATGLTAAGRPRWVPPHLVAVGDLRPDGVAAVQPARADHSSRRTRDGSARRPLSSPALSAQVDLRSH